MATAPRLPPIPGPSAQPEAAPSIAKHIGPSVLVRSSPSVPPTPALNGCRRRHHKPHERTHGTRLDTLVRALYQSGPNRAEATSPIAGESPQSCLCQGRPLCYAERLAHRWRPLRDARTGKARARAAIRWSAGFGSETMQIKGAQRKCRDQRDTTAGYELDEVGMAQLCQNSLPKIRVSHKVRPD